MIFDSGTPRKKVASTTLAFTELCDSSIALRSAEGSESYAAISASAAALRALNAGLVTRTTRILDQCNPQGRTSCYRACPRNLASTAYLSSRSSHERHGKPISFDVGLQHGIHECYHI